uniref:Putative secreted protein n=1 Tax=Ixodes ricinus TaxID=34613 RepID=A0A6B0UBF7_IXORI
MLVPIRLFKKTVFSFCVFCFPLEKINYALPNAWFPPKCSTSSPNQMARFRNYSFSYPKVTGDFLKLSRGKWSHCQ